MTTILLATAVLLAPQAELAKKVTFESVATRASRLLPELSKVAGVNLMSTGVTDDEVLVIRVVDAPLSELMKRIADVTNAEWKQESQGYRLVRPEPLVREEKRAEVQERSEAIRKLLENRRKTVAEQPPFESEAVARQLAEVRRQSQQGGDEQWKRVEAVSQQLPLSRALEQMVASLDPETLAALEPNTRTVYSTKPNRLQQPMPASVRPALDRLAREQARFAEAAERLIPKTDTLSYYQDRPIHADKDFAPGTRFLLVVIPRDPFTYRVTLAVMGEGDTTIARTGTFLSRFAERGYVSPDASTAASDPPQKIQLSRHSQSLLDAAMAAMREDGNVLRLPPETRKYLARPDLYDPLSLHASDMLLDTARKGGKNLVANLPDAAFNSLGLGMRGGGPTVPMVRAWLETDPTVVVRESKDWLEVEPRIASLARLNRADRGALSRLTRAALERTIGLDDKAAFEVSRKDYGYSMFGAEYAAFVVKGEPTTLPPVGTTELLRLYGSLNPAQRARWITGEPFPLASLGPSQMKEVERLVYHVEMPQFDLKREVVDGPEFYTQEPTELLPQGIPRNGTLSIKATKADIVMTASDPASPSRVRSEPMNADQLAWRLITQERPDLYPWVLEQPPIKLLHFGNRTTVRFQFEFTDQVGMGHEMFEYAVDLDKSYTVDRLPDTFKRELDRVIAERRKRMEEAQRRRDGGGSR